jgi:hypothetical protein
MKRKRKLFGSQKAVKGSKTVYARLCFWPRPDGSYSLSSPHDPKIITMVSNDPTSKRYAPAVHRFIKKLEAHAKQS